MKKLRIGLYPTLGKMSVHSGDPTKKLLEMPIQVAAETLLACKGMTASEIADLRVLREYMIRQIDAYVDACAEEVDEEQERNEMEAERRWEGERDDRATA